MSEGKFKFRSEKKNYLFDNPPNSIKMAMNRATQNEMKFSFMVRVVIFYETSFFLCVFCTLCFIKWVPFRFVSICGLSSVCACLFLLKHKKAQFLKCVTQDMETTTPPSTHTHKHMQTLDSKLSKKLDAPLYCFGLSWLLFCVK